MTPRRLALLIAPGLLLALAGCGETKREQEREPHQRNIPPPGFELASFRMGPSGDDGAAAPPATAPEGVVPLSPEQLAARIAAGEVRLIDVRSDAEVAESVIPGAEHIALDRFDPAKLDLSDGREAVLYCRSGRRSAIAAQRLAAALGAPVEHLEGGILAWQAAGQPIAPAPTGQ